MNQIAKLICESTKELNPSYLDSDNVLWKLVNGQWIGKKAIKEGNKFIWEDDNV